MNNKILSLFGLFLLVFWAASAQADQSQTFGDYVVHYNAFTTDNLQPETAKAYDITRSKNRAMLNIVVLEKVMGNPGRPVTAKVDARAYNLSAQERSIDIREVQDGTAIYYIGDFRVSDKETLQFTIEVTPSGSAAPHTIKFRQQFFTG